MVTDKKKSPRASNKLTAKFCDNAGAGNHFDGGGLFLRVSANSGSKLWKMLCYLDGKPKKLSFGKYPEVSLAQARAKRDEAKKLLAEGIDPIALKREKKAANLAKAIEENKVSGNTFEQVARRMCQDKQGSVSDDHVQKIIRQFEIHVFPVVGNKLVSEIKGAEWLELFRIVGAKKNNRGKLMSHMAKKLCQWASEVYDFASVEDVNFSENPCRIIVKRLKHKEEHMQRIPFSKIPDFLEKLKNYGGYEVTKSAIWMMLYTGVRQISVRTVCWRDIDLDNAIWHRPPEKRDDEVFDLPLPKQAIQLLERIKPMTGGYPDKFVFPSCRDTYYRMSEAAICNALKEMGVAMVGHGLRGLVSTGLNELGFNHRLVDTQLGHKTKAGAEGAYNDAKLFEARREMMQKWADYLDTLRGGV
jgi:integrase